MRLVRLAVATVGSALLPASLVALAGAPAQADSVGGGTNGNGYTLSVPVTVSSSSGDGNFAAPVSAVAVEPVCWWGPLQISIDPLDASDSEAMEEYITEMRNQMRGHAAAGYFALPTFDQVEAFVRQSQNTPLTWYSLHSKDGVNCAEQGATTSHGTANDAYGPAGAGPGGSDPIPVSVWAFPTADGPPPPVVDPEDLAMAVWDEVSQDIEGPDLDRNPKAAADGVAGATLVNMETWFWVQNVQEALAGDGLIELDITVPGTDVAASLTASTDGMQVSSPAGAATCTLDQAQTAYAAGVAEASACSFPFSQANTAGWEVTASTTWTGAWEGTWANGDQVGGDLETLTPSATSNVPVAESQAIVDEVG